MTVTVARPSRLAMTQGRRTDPFREVEDLQDRMSQLIDGLFGVPSAVAVRVPGWQTLADIEETDDAYIVDLDLPGVRAEDITVEVRENELRVSGEIKEKERKGVLRRQTRRLGQLEQVVALPSEVDPDQVEARLAHGVLTLRLGKSRARQARRVEIKS